MSYEKYIIFLQELRVVPIDYIPRYWSGWKGEQELFEVKVPILFEVVFRVRFGESLLGIPITIGSVGFRERLKSERKINTCIRESQPVINPMIPDGMVIFP